MKHFSFRKRKKYNNNKSLMLTAPFDDFYCQI